MKKSMMQNYARLIVRKGANVQRGQDVIISASVEQAEFVKLVHEACYRAGARRVIVDWSYQPMTKTTYRFARTQVLGRLENWEIERVAWTAEKLPAMIHLLSDDPDGLAGVRQDKMAKVQQMRYPILKPYQDRMENRYQWCIAAVPGRAWAKRVFPELRVTAAVERLWEMILYTSRADGADPVAAWDAHNADLAARCAHLNALGARELHYRASNGTDFRVGLIAGARFLGGAEKTLGGVWYNPNIPSEECFTSPMRGKAEGLVVATRPLSWRGQIIDDFTMTFHEGRVVDVTAGQGEALLRQMIAMDESAAYLGECALVPYDSPICRSGVTFYETLFDENACCHLALGAGFENCIENYGEKTLEECRAMGINDSMIHVDFMIGTEDLAIDAVCADGSTAPVFRDGNWAF